MEFLETLETIRAEEASVQRLYGDAGASARPTAKRQHDAVYLRKLSEAARLVADVISGRRRPGLLLEAMSTSDFPLLFGDIIDRQILASYKTTPVVWPLFCARKTVRDFRIANRFAIDGAETVLAVVPEGTGYPPAALPEARYQVSVAKYGRRLGFNWEAIINDDLDALKNIPIRFGTAASRTESKFATGLYADVNGPHASLYTVGNKNIVRVTNGAAANNPPLAIAGLQDAMTVMGLMVDAGGDPIFIQAIVLVVPPSLEVIARNILNATELRVGGTGAAGGGSVDQMLNVSNWMKSKMELAVDPYLPIVSTVAAGKTSWYLFARASEGERTALEVDFLRGHETPEVFMKTPNSTRVGGASNEMDGDFDTDSIDYKVRHCVGGGRQDPNCTVASFGDGSAP